MQRFFGILIFFSLLVALPGTALACGQDAAHTCKKAATEKMCAEKEHDETSATRKAHTCEAGHPGKKCPDNGGCCTGDGCNCPCGALTSSHSGIMLAGTPLVLAAFCDATLRQAFYFAQHMPKEVYLAIWQPPQLSA